MGIDPALVLRTSETNCELGNLQSEGHGISGFQTMLSIGLGQEQQFTLILQTLQQLRRMNRSVYLVTGVRLYIS